MKKTPHKRKVETYTTPEALAYAAKRGVPVTLATVNNWCKNYEGLARKVGGRWHIHRKRFKLLIDGRTWQSEGML